MQEIACGQTEGAAAIPRAHSQLPLTHRQPHWVCILPPLDCTYSAMGWSRRSAGDPLSMRSTDASVFVAKNWKMDSMHLAEICREQADKVGDEAGG